jgi:hypothetical protein
MPLYPLNKASSTFFMILYGSDLGNRYTSKFKYLESGVESTVEGILC